MPAVLTGITEPFAWSHYIHLVGIGPLWFAALLLIFDMGYLVYRLAAKNRVKHRLQGIKPLRFGAVAVFMLALAAASYLMRIAVPLGHYVLGFPSLAYLPQYIGLFVIGMLARKRDWLRTLPGSMGIAGFVLAVVAAATLFPLAFLSGANFLGGSNWQSAVYALWDSIFSVGICLAGIAFFRRYFDRETGFGRFAAQHSFAVYIIHIPVIVFVALALRSVHMGPVLKSGLAAVLGVPLCFGVAYLTRSISFAKKVL